MTFLATSPYGHSLSGTSVLLRVDVNIQSYFCASLYKSLQFFSLHIVLFYFADLFAQLYKGKDISLLICASKQSSRECYQVMHE